MALSTGDAALLRISKADKRLLTAYREAIYLTSLTAQSVDELQEQVCADRLALAEQFLTAGRSLMRMRPPQYRTAISRFYYCMYHSMRTVVYYVAGGDDHEAHNVLPGKTPADFTDADVWQNNLKDARGLRNEADYDPYPLTQAEFRDAALELQRNAAVLLDLARDYLRLKGCAHT